MSDPLRLEPLVVRGGLEPVDLQVARVLCRLGRDERPEVALAAALATRAPRRGHLCVELDRVAGSLAAELAEAGGQAAFDWPELGGWLALLGRSPVVRGPAEERETPLVLDGRRLYLDRYWRYQERLLGELRERAAGRATGLDLALLRDGLARLFPPEPGAREGELDLQRLAAAMAARGRLTVVSGGPGTGKTTIVTKLLALLLEQDEAGGAGRAGSPRLRVELAAPTAKAASRLGEALGEQLGRLETSPAVVEALAALRPRTIHRLLGARRDGPGLRHGRDDRLPADLVVVDEASMVDFALMTRLVEAVPLAARLVLLGDPDQLASVEAGSVLGDICGPARPGLRLSKAAAAELGGLGGLGLSDHATGGEAGGIGDCVVRLERVYRFGEASGIEAVARAVNAGEVEAALACLEGAEARYTDLELHRVGDDGALPAESLEAMVSGYLPLVEAALAGEVDRALEALGRFRVLCAHRRGALGVEGLCPAIERALELARPGFEASQRWYLGRPVLVRENDYGLGLFNGEAGVVVPHPEDGRRVVAFPRPGAGPRFVGPARLPAHATVFATTVHQGQGSQFARVVVVLPARPSPVLSRELLYTALTRAREHTTVVGSERAIRLAVEARVQRASGLSDKLWGPGAG